MSTIIIEKSTQNVNSVSGLSLTKPILDRLVALKRFNGIHKTGHSKCCQRYSNESIIKSCISLMTLGNSSFADINHYSSNELFIDVVGGSIASEATFRQRLEQLSECEHVQEIIDSANIELLQRVKELGTIEVASGKYTPIDIDVSVLINEKCKKENIGYTYHKKFGYAPIFATIGTHGYQLANELRPGEQHSQKGFIPFLYRCTGMATHVTKNKILIRLDSGHDADETLDSCFKLDDVISAMSNHVDAAPNGLSFIVKRNPRQEKISTWVEQAKCSLSKPYKVYRDAKKSKTVKIWRGEVAHKKTKSTMDRPLFCVYEVTETISDDELLPSYEVALWWTNLPDDPETIVELYHDHAVCEQFHSELKTDMDIEKLPSGDFDTNALILSLATLAFNSLRLIGQTYLQINEKNVDRIRLRTVLLRIIYVGGIMGSHGGRRILRLGRNCSIADTFIEIHRRLAA